MNIIRINVEDGRGVIDLAAEHYGDADRIHRYVRDARHALAALDVVRAFLLDHDNGLGPDIQRLRALVETEEA